MNTNIVFVPLEKIKLNRYQVEGVRDQAMVDEIKTSVLDKKDNGTLGLIEIPRARLNPDGTYEQAFGRHRFFAFEELFAEGHTEFGEMPLMVGEFSDEEMFELMGFEVFQHRTVDPIEEANIFQTYMKKFGKSSVAAAEKFGKTDEYVRGMVRLLNLPDEGIEMLKSGRVNKSDARLLLTLGKAGGTELVAEALEAIASSDADDSPADTIRTTARMSDKTKYLHTSDGWFSANKNFPHKHLPKLDEDKIADLIRYGEGYGTGKPINVAKDIATLIASGMEVTDEAFPQINPDDLARLRVLVNPTPCEKCPIHAVLDGDHICGLPLCRERKAQAWEKKVLEDKVAKIGVPMYQKSDGPFEKLSVYNDADKKLWNAGSPDLRLKEAKYEYNNFDGIDASDLCVVLVGEGYEKRKKKSDASKEREGNVQETAEARVVAFQLKCEFITRFSWNVASLAFEPIVEGATMGVMESLLYGLPSFGLPDTEEKDIDDLIDAAQKAKKADGAKQMRRLIAMSLICMELSRDEYEIDSDGERVLVDHAKTLQALASAWGVKLPKDFTSQAQAYQKELDAAIREVLPQEEPKTKKGKK